MNENYGPTPELTPPMTNEPPEERGGGWHWHDDGNRVYQHDHDFRHHHVPHQHVPHQHVPDPDAEIVQTRVRCDHAVQCTCPTFDGEQARSFFCQVPEHAAQVFQRMDAEITSLRAERDELSAALRHLQPVVDLQHQLQAEQERSERYRVMVDQQAEDDALWFVPDSIVEAYLQQELRKLHAAIESTTTCPQGDEKGSQRVQEPHTGE